MVRLIYKENGLLFKFVGPISNSCWDSEWEVFVVPLNVKIGVHQFFFSNLLHSQMKYLSVGWAGKVQS